VYPEILLPMYYMMWLTVAVFLFSACIRLKEIYQNRPENAVEGEEHRHPPFAEGSRLLKNAQRNLANLFEFPILFYVVCICIHMTGNSDDFFIQLAHWYFYLRVLHSVYHIFFNHLVFKGGFPVRSLFWLPSTGIMIYMWHLLMYYLFQFGTGA
jgi:hypothetical protein